MRTVNILSVGDELLIGQTVNTNAAWLARNLNESGFKTEVMLTVGDDKEAMKKALDRCFETAEVICMTGGLGPTEDDLTTEVLAEYTGDELTFREEMYEDIKALFDRMEKRVSKLHRAQCYVPSRAELLENARGTAPGMWIEWEDKLIISMPGVPYEMQYIMEEHVMDRLEKRFEQEKLYRRTIGTVGLPESTLADGLEVYEDQLPDWLKLAYLPSLTTVKLRLWSPDSLSDEQEEEADKYFQELWNTLGEDAYTEGDTSLEEVLGNVLKENEAYLATAESCTGGYLAHRITGIPGSSDYFSGSVISYSNEVKEKVLNVPGEVLRERGAVSEETVRAMVRGVLNVIPADVAIAISGIAGPGGGTEEKPVGTVWIAVGNEEKIRSFRIRAGKDRSSNIRYSAELAMDAMRKFLLEG